MTRRDDAPVRQLMTAFHRTIDCGLVAILGAWLVLSPTVLGYAETAQAVNDRIIGALVVALAASAFVLRRPIVAWSTGVLGLWELLAPVVLWAPTPASYASATLAGALIIFAGFIVPISRQVTGPAVPEGWSYNPSSWGQRAPVIVLSLASFGIAVYMASFQLGFIDRVVDPVFGDGTRRVLTSRVSQSFPVSDAALGAATYLVDLVMTCAGDTRRWRTMPWLVIVFGILIIPVGIVSIVLVMLQPIAVGAWCGWCLLTALATLIMIPLAFDEVGATLQLLRRARREGRPWLRILWRGDNDGAIEEPVPQRPIVRKVPWNIVAISLVGVWLMLEPAALGTGGQLATSTTITGALTLVVAAVAASEVVRPLRMAVIPIALWTMMAPWVLGGTLPTAHLSGPLCAAVLLTMGLSRGPVKQHRSSIDRIALWPSRRRGEPAPAGS